MKARIVGDQHPDIVFVNSPLYDYSRHTVPAEIYSRPLGLVALASYVRDHGLKAAIIDADDDRLSIPETLEAIRSLHPTWVGVNTFTPNFHITREIVKGIGDEAKVMLGGHHVSALPERTFRDPVFRDAIVVVGEAEKKVLGLMTGTDINTIPGIYRMENGMVIGQPDTPMNPEWVVMNLEEARTDYGVVPHNPFIAPDGTRRGYLMGVRGCPYACIFCRGSRDADWGYSVRMRPVDSIVAEIKFLKDTYGITDVKFEDDLLFSTQKRIDELSHKLIENGMTRESGFRWRGHGRANLIARLPDQSLDLMQESGCLKLMFGVERGTDEDMKAVKKNITTDQVRQTVIRLSDRGISTTGYFMVGFPDETKEQMEHTRDFARELHGLAKDHGMRFGVSAYMLRPYPGTPIWNDLIAKGVPEDALLDYALETEIGGANMSGRGTFDYRTQVKLHDVPPDDVLEILADMRAIGGYAIRQEGNQRIDEHTMRPSFRGKEG